MANLGIGKPKEDPIVKGAEAVGDVFKKATDAVKRGAGAVKNTVDKYTGKNQKWVDPQEKQIEEIMK